MNFIQYDKNGTKYINVKALLQYLVHKLPVILLTAVLVGCIALGGTYILIAPTYAANITLYVNNSSARSDATTLTQADLNASAHLVDTFAAILSSRVVLEAVYRQAQVHTLERPADLSRYISCSAVNNTEVMQITVTDTDPEEAARIANAISEIAPEQISSIVEGSSVKIIENAVVPTEKSGPHYGKITLVAAFLGGVLCVVFLVVKKLMNTTVTSESDLEQWGYPILSSIPDISRVSQMQHYGSKARGR